MKRLCGSCRGLRGGVADVSGHRFCDEDEDLGWSRMGMGNGGIRGNGGIVVVVGGMVAFLVFFPFFSEWEGRGGGWMDG